MLAWRGAASAGLDSSADRAYMNRRGPEILHPQHQLGGQYRLSHRLPEQRARHEEGRRVQPETDEQATERGRRRRGQQLLEQRLPLLWSATHRG